MAGTRNAHVRGLRCLAAAVVAATVVVVVPTTAGAQRDVFSDVTQGVHKPAIDALGEMGLFEGTLCGEDMFCPGEEIKRSTMAVWLIRALEETEPPEVGTSRFADVDAGAWWKHYVERLAELEVTVGCRREPLRYCPDRSVSRAQMASFLVRAFDLEPAEPAGFTDIEGSTHEDNINALAAASITVGCRKDPLQYCPTRAVSRAQMATFLARAMGLVDLPPPTESARVLSSREVHASVSPSIPRVETASAAGTGILVEGGHVLASYDVVWPYREASVMFPDGTALENVPVVGWDASAGLAVLGPVDVTAPALRLADGEDMASGSPVFLVGYPANPEPGEGPSVVRGVLTGVDDWEPSGITMLAWESDVVGGASRGALVSSAGEVVGVSTWRFNEVGLSVATSAADDASIVQMMVAPGDSAGKRSPAGVYWFGGQATGRGLRAGTDGLEFEVALANDRDSQAFFFEGTAGTKVTLSVEGRDDAQLRVAGADGIVLDVAGGASGGVSGTVDLPSDGPYFVDVSTVSLAPEEPPSYRLSSSVRLWPYEDPDDGAPLAVGDTVGGVIDYFSDRDWYTVTLAAGQTVVVRSDAMTTDTVICIAHPSAYLETLACDDDAGPSMFGYSSNAEIHYEASRAGRYHIIVEDAVGAAGGSYFLHVDRSAAP